MLASASWDRTVRLWDVASEQCFATLQGHTEGIYSVCFSPDGNMLASASWDRTVRLWDVHSNGPCLAILQGTNYRILSVCFSPDGCLLAGGSEDEAIRLWNVQSGECIRTLRSDRPYERMNITGATGLISAQIATLKALGAVEETAT